MVGVSIRIDYLEYISRYVNQSYPRRATWSELEASFDGLVAKYSQKWPELDTKVVKYSALYRLIETHWSVGEQFPRIEEFSFASTRWPSDVDTKSGYPSSTGYANENDELKASAYQKATIHATQDTNESSSGVNEIVRSNERLVEAAEWLSCVSRKVSRAFE